MEKQPSALIVPASYTEAVTIDSYVHKVFDLKNDVTTESHSGTPPLLLFVRFEDVVGNNTNPHKN